MNSLFIQYHIDIWDFLKSNPQNLIVNAGPGSGKTWSIKNLIIPALLETGLRFGGCIAFNKKNAMDLQKAIVNPGVECSTVHSALLKCLKKLNQYIKIEIEKEAGFDKFRKKWMQRFCDEKTREYFICRSKGK